MSEPVGVVTRRIREGYIAISWDRGVNVSMLRLGFVRQHSNGKWEPVVQDKGKLIPLRWSVTPKHATTRVVRYHHQQNNIDARYYRPLNFDGNGLI